MDINALLKLTKFVIENGQNIFFISALLLSWIGFFRFLKSYHWKIYKSLKGKTVRFIKTEKKDFDQEMMVLRNSQIIELDEHIFDYSKINTIEDLNRKMSSIESKSILVIEYSDNFHFYKETLEMAYDKNLPIVMYATSRMSDQDDKEVKNSKHPYIEICNTSVRMPQAIINLCLVHT